MTNNLVTNKPFIQQSPLTERWYFVATWNETSNGMRVAETKIDVTDEIARIRSDEREHIAETLPTMAGWNDAEADTIRLAQKRIRAITAWR